MVEVVGYSPVEGDGGDDEEHSIDNHEQHDGEM